MIEPKGLCRKHLLGEHSELHKFRHSFVKQHRIDGRMSPVVQIEPTRMGTRHEQLVKEMLRRGYKHKSQYLQPDVSYLPEVFLKAHINIQESIRDLKSRCPECKAILMMGKDLKVKAGVH